MSSSSSPYDGQTSQLTPPNTHSRASSTQGPIPQLEIPPPQPAKSVKRPRPVKSCRECRKRKLRCDRLCPCSQCQKTHRVCRYAVDQDPAAFSDGSEEDMADSPPFGKRRCGRTASLATTKSADNSSHSGKVDGAALAVVEELAMRMGQLERHFVGQKSISSVSTGLPTKLALHGPIRGLKVKQNGYRTRLYGQSSTRLLMNMFPEAEAFLASQEHDAGTLEILSSFRKLHTILQEEHQRSLEPIAVCLDPLTPIKKRMMDMMPSKPICDRLLKTYLDSAEVATRIIHLPTFNEEYIHYWDGLSYSESFLPLLLAMLAVASRFRTRSRGFGHETVEGVHIPTTCALIRSWLDSLKGKQLTDLSTLQVEVALLIAQKITTAHEEEPWAQLGAVVRKAMAMGLHRDPSEFEDRLSPFVMEIRRRIWYGLLELDIKASFTCKLPCVIREGDFTTRPPRNLEDSDLQPDMLELPPGRPLDQHTRNQAQCLASTTIAARMRVANLINRIDAVEDFQEIMDLGSTLERLLEDVDQVGPVDFRRWRIKEFLQLQILESLWHLFVPFAFWSPEAPPRISRVVLTCAMRLLTMPEYLDSKMATTQHMTEMFYELSKRDVVEAAMAVCSFYQSHVRPLGDRAVRNEDVLRLSADQLPENVALGDRPVLWSPEQLLSVAEKALEGLMENITGGDTKDIVCLAVTIETMKNPVPKAEAIVHRLRSVLGACLRAANVNLEKRQAVAPPPPQPPLLPQGVLLPQQGATYMSAPMHMGAEPDLELPISTPEMEMTGWLLWDGWK